MPENSTIALVVSIASLALSAIALIATYRQRARQDRLGTRKTLSDTIQNLSGANIAMEQLLAEPPTPEMMSIRRNLNSQRRYLAEHAELLAAEIPALTTDIDYNFIARAFDAAGDTDRAEAHWKRCIEKSVAPTLRAMNLRGYARFAFSLGNPQEARRLYQQSLQIALPDNDRGRIMKADTFVMWALAERDYGFLEESGRLREQAVVEAGRIGAPSSRESQLKYIANLWQSSAREPASVAAEPGPEPRQP